MKGHAGIILALIFALIIAIFSVINVDSVTVNFLFVKADWPLILVILVSVLMGALIVGSIGYVRIYKLQKELKKAQADLKKYQGEGDMLRKQLIGDEGAGLDEKEPPHV
ncbi:putative integral membrane protein [Scopulibacillus daqui]|uniref:Integral membrane protein n=1 Tax=Scopulibacillus daqui TaxID=1469162 RepID=A0ABS2PXG1_9BACL|nr:lipopolysaccharide assembly protein LapA domain-containing protein [Scopulibacillus daqui]MBM7644690.1 putative integral membrane protein [Scopulibacillus daqui]